MFADSPLRGFNVPQNQRLLDRDPGLRMRGRDQDPQASGINGKRLRQSEFHAEVRDAVQTACVRFTAVPARLMQIAVPLRQPSPQFLREIDIRGELLQSWSRDALQNEIGILGPLPGFGIQGLPELIGSMAPRPAQIKGKFPETFQARWQNMIELYALICCLSSVRPPQSARFGTSHFPWQSHLTVHHASVCGIIGCVVPCLFLFSESICN